MTAILLSKLTSRCRDWEIDAHLLNTGCRPFSLRMLPSKLAQLRSLLDGNDFLTRRLADVLAQRTVKAIVL